jgi:hypothetical protein
MHSLQTLLDAEKVAVISVQAAEKRLEYAETVDARARAIAARDIAHSDLKEVRGMLRDYFEALLFEKGE